MTSSRSYFSKMAYLAQIAVFALTGCAGHSSSSGTDAMTTPQAMRIAVLPLDNLSGTAAPLKALRQEMIARLQTFGVSILPDAELETFMARHRLRYVGGINRDDAVAFHDETKVDAVVVTSLELYNESYPPRIALTTRLVSTGSTPRILRIGNAAMTGDETPGLLGIGLIENPAALRTKAISRLLTELMVGGEEKPGPSLAPISVFHNQPLDPAKRYTVTVLPFFNKSNRRYAGEIVALHFIRELARNSMFSVLEPGVARQELLQYRIIMEEGVSLSDAELVFGVMRADLLFTGNVNDYEDTQGTFGAPKVDFTALMLNSDNRKAGWAVDAHALGNDRVYLFDMGRLTTANALAAAMTRGAITSLTATDFAGQP